MNIEMSDFHATTYGATLLLPTTIRNRRSTILGWETRKVMTRLTIIIQVVVRQHLVWMKLWVTLDELVSSLGAMNPVLVFSENSYVENLMPKVMVLGGGIIGK